MSKAYRKYLDSKRFKWIITIISGLWVFYILFVFNAYQIQTGISFSGHTLFVRSFWFGVVNSLTFAFFEFGLSRFFKRSGWLQQGIWLLIEFIVAAHMTYFLFNVFWNWTEMYWDSYFLMMRECVAMMITPLLISYGIGFIPGKKKAISEDLISFSSENGKDLIKLKLDDLLFIKSAGNYVEVFAKNGDETKKQLLRNSLKSLEEDESLNQFLVRSHRSYLVNPGNVVRIIQSKGKMELELKSLVIPVSSKYESNFTG